jgi:hypothetical protein
MDPISALNQVSLITFKQTFTAHELSDSRLLTLRLAVDKESTNYVYGAYWLHMSVLSKI